MEEQHLRIKLAIKEMERTAKQAKKDEENLKLKVKKAIETQDQEIAKIHAESAIRKKNEQIKYTRLAARLDCVCSKIGTAIKTQNVSKIMKSTVKGLNRALETKDVSALAQTMQTFEEQTISFDEYSGSWSTSVKKSAEKETPEADVNELIEKVADEYGLELSVEMFPENKQKSSIEERLKKLKEI